MKSLTYLKWFPFIGGNTHDSLIFVPPLMLPVVLPLWHLSLGVVNGFTSLLAWPSDADGKVVEHKGMPFVGFGNDAGPLVVHITIPIGWNPMLPMTIIFGSSNTVFASHSVEVLCDNPIFGEAGQAMSCTLLGPVPVGVDLSCGDPWTMPTDFPILWSTVMVDLSWDDISKGLIEYATAVAMDGLMVAGGQLMKRAGRSFKGPSNTEVLVSKGALKTKKGAADEVTELRKTWKNTTLPPLQDDVAKCGKKVDAAETAEELATAQTQLKQAVKKEKDAEQAYLKRVRRKITRVLDPPTGKARKVLVGDVSVPKQEPGAFYNWTGYKTFEPVAETDGMLAAARREADQLDRNYFGLNVKADQELQDLLKSPQLKKLEATVKDKQAALAARQDEHLTRVVPKKEIDRTAANIKAAQKELDDAKAALSTLKKKKEHVAKAGMGELDLSELSDWQRGWAKIEGSDFSKVSKTDLNTSAGQLDQARNLFWGSMEWTKKAYPGHTTLTKMEKFQYGMLAAGEALLNTINPQKKFGRSLTGKIASTIDKKYDLAGHRAWTKEQLNELGVPETAVASRTIDNESVDELEDDESELRSHQDTKIQSRTIWEDIYHYIGDTGN